MFREHEILREEVRSLQEVRAKLQTRLQDQEDELRRIKEEAERGRKEKEEEDEEVPMAQRKRFTRYGIRPTRSNFLGGPALSWSIKVY